MNLCLLLMMRPCGHSAHACCASVCNCCPGRHGQQPLPAGLRPCQACNRCCCPACQQWVRPLAASAPPPRSRRTSPIFQGIHKEPLLLRRRGQCSCLVGREGAGWRNAVGRGCGNASTVAMHMC